MKKEIEAETKKAAEADRKHKATVASGETRTVSTRTARSDSDNGDNGKAAAPSGPKLSAAQTKQLAKLLDSYLKAHPDARSRNVEELRNQLSLTPN
jgi:hypothetical protein